MNKRTSKYALKLSQLQLLVDEGGETERVKQMAEDLLCELRWAEDGVRRSIPDMDLFDIEEWEGVCCGTGAPEYIYNVFYAINECVERLRELDSEIEFDGLGYERLYNNVMRKLNYNPADLQKYFDNYQEKRKRMFFAKNSESLRRAKGRCLDCVLSLDSMTLFSSDFRVDSKREAMYVSELENYFNIVLPNRKTIESYSVLREFYDMKDGRITVKDTSDLAKYFYLNRDLLNEEEMRLLLSYVSMLDMIDDELGDDLSAAAACKVESDEATVFRRLREAGYLDKNDRPADMDLENAALLANEIAIALHIKNKWAYFARKWGYKKEQLRQAYIRISGKEGIGEKQLKYRKMLKLD